jgi:hypothetical protein
MFVKLNIKEVLDQRTQTEFADPKQTSRNDRVEDLAGGEIQTAPQHAQIVIGGVQNNFFRFQRVAQRLQIEIAQRINNEIILTALRTRGRRADLDQAKFLPI